MTFPHFNRRLHLYLAMFLMPWFIMYGVSSWIFNHGPEYDRAFQAKKVPNFVQRFERPYDVPVPEGNLRPLADQIVADTGVSGSYGAYRQGPDQINVYVYRFWHSIQIKYFLKEKRLVLEDATFRWDHFFTGMHSRGGFEQGGIADFWSIVVDLVCVGMLLWVATGLYMWWKMPPVRMWGWIALAAGFASFALFLVRL